MDSVADLYILENQQNTSSIQRLTFLCNDLRKKCSQEDRLAVLCLWHLEDLWVAQKSSNNLEVVFNSLSLDSSAAIDVLNNETGLLYNHKYDIVAEMDKVQSSNVCRKHFSKTSEHPKSIVDLYISRICSNMRELANGTTTDEESVIQGGSLGNASEVSMAEEIFDPEDALDEVTSSVMGLETLLTAFKKDRSDNEDKMSFVMEAYVPRLASLFDLFIYNSMKLVANRGMSSGILHNLKCDECLVDSTLESFTRGVCCPYLYLLFIRCSLSRTIIKSGHMKWITPILEKCYLKILERTSGLASTIRRLNALVLFKVQIIYYELQRLRDWSSLDLDIEDPKKSVGLKDSPFFKWENNDLNFELSSRESDTSVSRPTGPYSCLSYWSSLNLYRRAMLSTNNGSHLGKKLTSIVCEGPYNVHNHNNHLTSAVDGTCKGGLKGSVYYNGHVFEDTRLLLHMNQNLMEKFGKYGEELGLTLLDMSPVELVKHLEMADRGYAD